MTYAPLLTNRLLKLGLKLGVDFLVTPPVEYIDPNDWNCVENYLICEATCQATSP